MIYRRFLSNFLFLDFVRNRWLILTVILLLFLGLSGGYIGPEYGLYLLFRDLSLAATGSHNGAMEGILGAPLVVSFYVSLGLGCLYVFHIQDRLWKKRRGEARKFGYIYKDARFFKLFLNLLPITGLPFILFSYAYSSSIQAPTHLACRLSGLGAVLATILVGVILWGVSNMARSPHLAFKTLKIGGFEFCTENILLVLALTGGLALMQSKLSSYLTINNFVLLFLLILVTHLYFLLVPFHLKPFAVAFFLVVLLGAQSAKYKYHFSGMKYVENGVEQSYYDHPRKLQNEGSQKKSSKLIPAKNGTNRLVVITASGGGYRSTFWSASVLDNLRRLEEDGGLPGFSKSVRLLSGASGGSVALGYYLIANIEANSKSVVDLLLQDLSNFRRSDLDSPKKRSAPWVDSLSPVTKQLVTGDFFHLFTSRVQVQDRGTVLENQWKSLDVSFGKLQELEADGKIPTIILSPVIVDSGDPLLISNFSSKDFGVSDQEGIYNIFEAYPGIKENFRLSTAVRMSATFPIVSPAVDLPSEPPLRIADGGFFDSQGTYWVGRLLQASAEEIVRHYDRVIWIEMDAFSSENPNTPEFEQLPRSCISKAEPNGVAPSRLLNAAKWFTAPFQTLLNARERSMWIRAGSDFLAVKGVLEAVARANARKLIVERFRFSSHTNASLSWVLRGEDLYCMLQELDTPSKESEFNRLIASW